MNFFSRTKRLLIGHPLQISELSHQKIPKWKALAVLSSDALSSVAYATEEILIPLAAFSALAVTWSIPIALTIALVLILVTISYQQTISSYPNGGGAYIVSKENLGTTAGLIAGAALLIDYVLTVAVSVSAGVENIASAFQFLWPYREVLGIFVVLLIMTLNLRGIRESATIFALPTYLFIFSFLILIGKGAWDFFNGNVVPVAPVIHETYTAIPIFLALKAFSSGCSALTGVEAISNGIPIFKEPSQRNAKITMLWMAGILGLFFIGITLLAHLHGISPVENQTVISILSKKIFGDSFFYYLTQASTALILVLAANTSYADFPRLASLLAKDRFLPRQLSSLGDRLVFSNGIIGLSFAAMMLIIYFKGETHYLIPLYAVGVFLSFTLSQAGMVIHHIKYRESGWRKGIVINSVGAIATLIVLLVISFTKFIHGAWVVIIFIPFSVFIFNKIKSHYVKSAFQLRVTVPPPKSNIEPTHIIVIPVSGVHRGVIKAVDYATSMSENVFALYVDIDSENTERLKIEWKKFFPNVELKTLPSPYRSLNEPLINHIVSISKDPKWDWVTVVIPEFVAAKWWENLLHNQSALFIKTFLMFKKRIVVTSVRYHL
jgi:amino acid transporter